jgi:hypothetical protein
MPTPSIQTLRTDAQQVLNLDSISAVRSVVAATLANANAGTPLNPNLTTQQLWNEFYQIVTQPKSDIESIIANQLMKFLYAPPAPGGVGANKQVIFNDNGLLAGDAGLTYDKATDSLTVGNSIGIREAAINGIALLSAVTTAGMPATSGTTQSAGSLRLTATNTTGCLDIGTAGAVSWLQACRRTNLADNFALVLNPNGGNVGVNTASANNALTVRGTQDTGIEINSADSNASRLIFAYDPANTRWYINSTLSGSGTTLPLAFLIQNSEVARFNTTGNLAFANGKGIDFSATPSGSGTMTSELLNDYEEGTWTIGISFGGAATGITYTQNTGKYTKVGRLVTVFGAVDLLNKGSSTGNAAITGLPFTIGSASSDYSAASLQLVNITFADFPMGFGNPTTTTIPLQEVTNAGVRTNLTDADFANNSAIIFSLTYSV